MTPIEKLARAARMTIDLLVEDESMDWPVLMNLKKQLEEYESAPKPVAFPVEIDVEFKDGDWLTVDSDGSGEKHIIEPVKDDYSFGGFWRSEGGRFFAIFKTPDDWKNARWQLVEGKWVQK